MQELQYLRNKSEELACLNENLSQTNLKNAKAARKAEDECVELKLELGLVGFS